MQICNTFWYKSAVSRAQTRIIKPMSRYFLKDYSLKGFFLFEYKSCVEKQIRLNREFLKTNTGNIYWYTQIGIDIFIISFTGCLLLQNDGQGNFTVLKKQSLPVALRSGSSYCKFSDKFFFISGGANCNKNSKSDVWRYDFMND